MGVFDIANFIILSFLNLIIVDGRLLPQGLGGAMDRLGPYRGPRRPIAPPR